LDNAANNKTMMKELQKLLAEREIPFEAEDSRISCFPHVVNLATQRILQSLTNVDHMGETDDFEDDDDEGQGTRASDGEEDGEEKDGEEGTDDDDGDDDDDDTDADDDDSDDGSDKNSDTNAPRKGATTYQEACKMDPITLCRKIARTVRSSGQRRDELDELILKGNKKGWFKVNRETVQVPQLQLLLDVKTRWDSVFTMIKRFIELQPVRPILLMILIFLMLV
jgi:hypothetical protein